MRYNDHKESLTIINSHKTVLNVLEEVQKSDAKRPGIALKVFKIFEAR
jgi:hypothetical protein